ncbi:MAG: hypothetical protein KDK76_02210 [Chlamydiia bacterium]|nr:hypothetical protein [Chlamydiia bacterium]
MSTLLNTNDQNDTGLSFKPEVKSDFASKGSLSHASLDVSTTALLGALQAPSGAVGDDFSILSFILSEDESEEMRKGEAKQSFNLSHSDQVKANAAASDAPETPEGSQAHGKNAIALSAELMSELQYKQQKSMTLQLKADEEALNDELIAAQRMETLWSDFIKDWQNYKKDQNFKNFQKLENDLIAIYGKNSKSGKEAEKEIKDGKWAWNKQQWWNQLPWYDRAKHPGDWFHHSWWSDFLSGENSKIEGLAGVASTTTGIFDLALNNMNEMIKDRVKDLTLQMQFLQIMISILSGSGSAVTKLQSLMNVMMEIGIQNNQESTQRNQFINNFNIMSMKNKEQQIDKELAKIHASEQHHGGLLGWIEDLFNSIVDIFKEIAHIVAGVCSGESFGTFAKQMEKLTGVKKFIDDLKEMFTAKSFGDFLNGLEDFASAAIVVAVMGPGGMALLDTKIGKDMTQAVKLVIDTIKAVVVSLSELFVALCADHANPNLSSKLVSDAGDIWKKVSQNPQIKAVMQLAMVAIIIASAMTGQIELAVFMAALFILSTTGALQKWSEDMAKDMGNSAVDKVISDVIVITIITIASAGVGALSGAGEVAADDIAETASNAARRAAEEEGEEITTDTVNQTSDSVTNTAENQKPSKLQKLADFVGKKGGAALTGLGTSMLDTNFGVDLAKAIDKHNKKLLEALEGLFDALAAVFAAIGGLGMTMGESGSSGALSSALKKAAPKLAEYLEGGILERLGTGISNFFEGDTSRFAQLASTLQKAGLIAQGMGSVEMGISEIAQGEMRATLEKFNAEMTQITASTDDTTRELKDLATQFKALMKREESENKNLYNAAGSVEHAVTQRMLQG